MSIPKTLHIVVASHLSQIPQSESLVLAVGNDIAAIAFGRNVCDTFSMPHQNPGRLLRRQRSSIPVGFHVSFNRFPIGNLNEPNFEVRVIGRAYEYVARPLICPTAAVYIVIMGLDPDSASIGQKVIDYCQSEGV
jgi:hypothetical protein